MVIATLPMDILDGEIPLQASRGFIAVFDDDAAQFPPPGTTVNVLFACVRTAARILDVSVQRRDGADAGGTMTKVSVELVHSRKWAELGTSVIIMGNGSQDGSGLQGFVGKITEVVC
jgi:hypothetical protein